jgi:hypothetical protein
MTITPVVFIVSVVRVHAHVSQVKQLNFLNGVYLWGLSHTDIIKDEWHHRYPEDSDSSVINTEVFPYERETIVCRIVCHQKNKPHIKRGSSNHRNRMHRKGASMHYSLPGLELTILFYSFSLYGNDDMMCHRNRMNRKGVSIHYKIPFY